MRWNFVLHESFIFMSYYVEISLRASSMDRKFPIINREVPFSSSKVFLKVQHSFFLTTFPEHRILQQFLEVWRWCRGYGWTRGWSWWASLCFFHNQSHLIEAEVVPSLFQKEKAWSTTVYWHYYLIFACYIKHSLWIFEVFFKGEGDSAGKIILSGVLYSVHGVLEFGAVKSY